MSTTITGQATVLRGSAVYECERRMGFRWRRLSIRWTHKPGGESNETISMRRVGINRPLVDHSHHISSHRPRIRVTPNIGRMAEMLRGKSVNSRPLKRCALTTESSPQNS